MNNLMVFENRQVEVFELDGKVLFNPGDVAACLEIKDVNSVIRGFNENQKVKLTNSNMHSMHFRKLHNTGENFLTESGVYKLIFKSRKAEAEKFQDWVTDEVLPSIRKTGEYKIPQIEDIMIAQLKEQKMMKANIEKVEKEVKEFKEECPLFNIECDELQATVKRTAVAALGGYNNKAYKNKSIRAKVFSDIQRELKRQFNIKSYKAIKRGDIHVAKKIIDNYKLPIFLENEIISINNQVQFHV